MLPAQAQREATETRYIIIIIINNIKETLLFLFLYLLLLQFFSYFVELLLVLFFASVRAAPEHVPCGQPQQRTRLISFRDFMRLRDLRQFCMADPSRGDPPPLSHPLPCHAPYHRTLHCRRSVSVFITVSHFISNLFIVLFSPAYFIYYIFSRFVFIFLHSLFVFIFVSLLVLRDCRT